MILICILDICKVIDLSKKWCFITYLFFMPHLPLLWFHFWISKVTGNSSATTYLTVTMFAIATVIFQLYTTLRLHFQSVRKNKTDKKSDSVRSLGAIFISCLVYRMLFCFANKSLSGTHRTYIFFSSIRP